MTDPDDLGTFVVEFLESAGARVTPEGLLLWVDAPTSLGDELALGSRFPLTLDPDASGRFGAELVAPGSFALERILGAAARRGREGTSTFRPGSEAWPREAFVAGGLVGLSAAHVDTAVLGEERLLVFAFRVSLTSDEKEESFHLVAVDRDGETWPIRRALPWSGLEDGGSPPGPSEVDAARRLAEAALGRELADEVEAFRNRSVQRLDEEVRRILRYYDRTVEEIRAAGPTGLPDLVRAVEAERDRRLGEALERFDPKAAATLTSIRAVTVPTANLEMRPTRNGIGSIVVRVDAWTCAVRGARCARCGASVGPWTWRAPRGLLCAGCAPTTAASARPRAGRRSGTPPRGNTVGPDRARSPRGPRAQPRGGDGPGRRP